MSYLRQAQVRAFFSSEGEMIAGYAVNLQRPLRYEEWIPEASRGSLPVLSSNLRLGEMTVTWIYEKPEPFFSERVYIRAFVDAIVSGAQFVIGGILVPKVYGIHIQCLPQVIYIGETHYFGKPEPCWIYGAPRSVMLGKLLTAAPLELFGKLLGRPSYRDKARRIAEAEDRRTGGAGDGSLQTREVH